MAIAAENYLIEYSRSGLLVEHGTQSRLGTGPLTEGLNGTEKLVTDFLRNVDLDKPIVVYYDGSGKPAPDKSANDLTTILMQNVVNSQYGGEQVLQASNISSDFDQSRNAIHRIAQEIDNSKGAGKLNIVVTSPERFQTVAMDEFLTDLMIGAQERASQVNVWVNCNSQPEVAKLVQGGYIHDGFVGLNMGTFNVERQLDFAHKFIHFNGLTS